MLAEKCEQVDFDYGVSTERYTLHLKDIYEIKKTKSRWRFLKRSL